MNINMIITALAPKQNGSFIKMEWVTDLPLTSKAKSMGVTAYKITNATVRKGIDYKKQKSVQMKVENGKILTHELPWGSWMKGYEGLLIEHNGKTYLRLYNTPNKPVSRYFLNGIEITKEEMINAGVVQGSYWEKNSPADALTVNTANIQAIW